LQNSAYLVGMPPDKAVKILLAMEDQDVIDLMRVTEELAAEAGEASLVAYWLSLMPADRAAALQRKMARKSGG
jgi:flagellar protein FlbB